MVQADQRRGFRQPIALDHGVSQAMPELLGFRIERRASADHCPEFPAKLPSDLAEGPPAAQEMLAFRPAIAFCKLIAPAAVFEVALHLLLQRLEHAGHRRQHRNALPPDRRHDFRGIEGVLEDDGAAQQRRKENPQELSEHVAHRQQVQESDGMHPPLVLQILLDLGLDRRHVSQHVGVAEHDALWLGGGSRGEDDLQHISRLNLNRTKRLSRMPGDSRFHVRRIDYWNRVEYSGALARTDNQLRSDLQTDPAGEIRTRSIVHRNRNHPAERASKECRHPLRAVRAPEQHRVALADVARLQFARKAIGTFGHTTIAPALAPVTAWINVGALVAPALEIVQVVQQTCPHTLFSSTIPEPLQCPWLDLAHGAME